MRVAVIFLAWALLAVYAEASDFAVDIKAERSFGYFLGDIVRSIVVVRGPMSAELVRASLPHPGALRNSLDLRDVSVEETRDAAGRVWKIHLGYQNFYAALDVRNIDVPGFELSFDAAGERNSVNVPGWRFAVAPLREIVPEQKASGADYMRPDPDGDFVDDVRPATFAILSAVLGVSLCLLVAWDRGWPPFRARPARVFSAAAHELVTLARQRDRVEALRVGIRTLHRAFDQAGGRSLLGADLQDFIRRRPEFARLETTAERFFRASEDMFFGANPSLGDYTMDELVGFAQAMAERERAG